MPEFEGFSADDESEQIAPQQVDSKSLGPFLRSIREGLGMTLREVEEATQKAVSNAYLSQLETNKISKPSPHILFALANVLGTSYEGLMERAGYMINNNNRPADAKHGRAATFAIENLSAEEEKALLDHLSFIRWQRKGK